jgi:PadR family transcriptional regulator, regulatory protein PadR
MGTNLPSISATESLVMDLLREGERFGLELVEQSAGSLKRGSVYVILSRMEAKGFVTSRLDDSPKAPAGPTRRLYAVTAYGLQVHQAYGILRQALALRPARGRA